MGKKLAIGIGGGGEAVRHIHAGIGEMADHFAQRGVLAADRLDVVHSQLAEPGHVLALQDVSPQR